MAELTLRQAAQWCGGIVESKYENVRFRGAEIDSRKINPGQMFVALKGVRDGHDFIESAIEKGAAAVLCTRLTGDYPASVVKDTRIAVGQIAAGLRSHSGMTVVGVTGSVGKSTTKEMVAAVLEGDFAVSKTPANFNNDLGLPMALLGMDEDTQVAVLEMGMSHFGEIRYLTHIAKPDVAVITNIGTMHMENLGSKEGILKAKLEILEGMKASATLCVNADDGMLWDSRAKIAQKQISFGWRNQGGDVCGTNVEQTTGALRFDVKTEEGSFPVALPLEGEHFVLDALSAIAVGFALGVSAERMQQRLSRFRNMEGRQELFEAKGVTIIKDCYNAGPESMAAALKVLKKRSGRRIAVLGDMLELGTITEIAHAEVGQLACQCADVLLCYGPNAPVVARGAKECGMKDVIAFDDRTAMASHLRAICRQGDVLLFKGSHGMHMELVLEGFLRD